MLRFRLPDLTMAEKELATEKIMKPFSNEKALPKHSVLRSDPHIPKKCFVICFIQKPLK